MNPATRLPMSKNRRIMMWVALFVGMLILTVLWKDFLAGKQRERENAAREKAHQETMAIMEKAPKPLKYPYPIKVEPVKTLE